MRLDSPARNLTLAVTGASGAVFARAMLRLLERDARVERVNLIASDGGLRVMAEELGIAGRNDLASRLLGAPAAKVALLGNDDIGACVASGSYPAEAMVVLPCSMGTLSRIAQGAAQQLIERAADVCLKEQRPLILCVRETPLNKVHLRNMTVAADAGATIFPIMPAFYLKPVDAEAMAEQFVRRVLSHVGLEQDDMQRWKG